MFKYIYSLFNDFKMIIQTNFEIDFINHHDLRNNYCIVDNYNWYWVITEEVNGELWFNVFYNPNYEYVEQDYVFSSQDLGESLDYCGILHCPGEHY